MENNFNQYNVKNETKIENERNTFEQTFKHFCLDKKLDAWGESVYAQDTPKATAK